MDIKELIESNKSPEAIASGLYQEDTAFEKLSEELTECTLGETPRYKEVFAKDVDLDLTDPSQFDNSVTTICYGRLTNESYFIHLQTTEGTTYSIGRPRSLKEAESQAVVLSDQTKLNLQELMAKEVH